jgi:hypothetical protein
MDEIKLKDNFNKSFISDFKKPQCLFIDTYAQFTDTYNNNNILPILLKVLTFGAQFIIKV